MQLITKSWLDSNTFDHVKTVNDLGEMVKKKFKVWYDRKAREVSYKVGDQVLLLLPLVGKPLQAKYCRKKVGRG